MLLRMSDSAEPLERNGSARVLAIGLDSVDRRYLWRLIEAGDLPNIGSVVTRGRHGVVRSPEGLGDDATWSSFSASTYPGEHGRFYWNRLVPGTYRTGPHGEPPEAGRPFWSKLAEQGRRVAVLDVPKSPFVQVPGGVQLSDWLVHGRDGSTRSHPPEVAAEVLERFGDDRIDRIGTADYICRSSTQSPELQAELLRRLREGLAAKRAFAPEFLGREAWDLFLVVFKEGHCAGHQFWGRTGEPENPVRDIYRELDAAVGDLLELVDVDTHVMIFSGLGMAANYTAEHLLEKALLRLDPSVPGWIAERWATLEDVEERVRRRFSMDTAASWTRARRCLHQVPHNELSGAIRINLRGREPGGRVNPGAEYEAWCRRLEREAMSWVDPETGHHVVDRVVRADDAHPGAERSALPDLFVVWKRDRPIRGLYSPTIGVISERDPAYRAGNHVADGFYVVAGPSVSPSGPAGPVSIVDLGPTLGSWLGVDLPGVSGRPI
jgi:predicted AlkP superfamily phosphohydrolase/phosphomutase